MAEESDGSWWDSALDGVGGFLGDLWDTATGTFERALDFEWSQRDLWMESQRQALVQRQEAMYQPAQNWSNPNPLGSLQPYLPLIVVGLGAVLLLRR